MSYTITKVSPRDTRMLAKVDALLMQEGIRRDANLDTTLALLDDDYEVIATGSAFGNTLRCFAVDHGHQGEGLLNEIVTQLMEVEMEKGNTHLFLYTKPGTAKFFSDLGFYEIARVPGKLVFMENRRDGFARYLKSLEQTKKDGTSAAVVMNANPFTLGHQYLAETAAGQCDYLHLFVVSEDLSLVPAAVRRQLVQAGTAHLNNVILHDCGPYIISSATFPSYFLKDQEDVIESQARLDLAVFCRIAQVLDIRCRFVGEEPLSLVTGIYNLIMTEALPEAGIACTIVPRKTLDGAPISASAARAALKQGNFDAFRRLVPPSTARWFESPEASSVLERIRQSENVIHY